MLTLKQQKAAKLAAKTKSMGEAMIGAGYSPSMARSHPDRLTKNEEFMALLDKELRDDAIVQAHKDALKATKIHTSHTEPDIEVPDHQTRLKAVDLAYKIKDRYPKEGIAGGLHFHQHIEEQKAKYA